ncbi:hypothetical protein LCGC14_1628830 [marine sediment metagenome]|uniref:Uncharacterized protein n=1 Tax=marine sediment metagenome TaxID=412755 RepID=A0A0F9L325_9ZZZZ|nr:MAG: hypothetical protein Lokiarch_52080 [Candidatus Lokiarchaeum sp. GC14_75]
MNCNTAAADDYSSWNYCDEILKSCIERSEFVNQTRTRLKKKKLMSKQHKNQLKDTKVQTQTCQ